MMGYYVVSINTASVFKNAIPRIEGYDLYPYEDAVETVERIIRHSKVKFYKINNYVWEGSFEDGKIILVICVN